MPHDYSGKPANIIVGIKHLQNPTQWSNIVYVVAVLILCLFILMIIWLLQPEKPNAIEAETSQRWFQRAWRWMVDEGMVSFANFPDLEIYRIVRQARSLSDSELIEWADCLYRKTSAFLPSEQLRTEALCELPDPLTQIKFLIAHLNMPYIENIGYGLAEINKEGDKDKDGFVVLPYRFHLDTHEIGPLKRLFRVEADQSYSILDTSDKNRPLLVKKTGPVATIDVAPKIYIKPRVLRDPRGLASVICHEVAHLFLYFSKAHPPRFGMSQEEKIRMEVETDIGTIFMGCGLIMLATNQGSYLAPHQLRKVQEWYQLRRD